MGKHRPGLPAWRLAPKEPAACLAGHQRAEQVAFAPVPLHPTRGRHPELPRALVLPVRVLGLVRMLGVVRLLRLNPVLGALRLRRLPASPVQRPESTVPGRPKVQPGLVPILDWAQPAAPGRASQRVAVADHPRRVQATKAVHRVTVAVRHRRHRVDRMWRCGQIRPQPAKDQPEVSRRATRTGRTRCRWEPRLPHPCRGYRLHH